MGAQGVESPNTGDNGGGYGYLWIRDLFYPVLTELILLYQVYAVHGKFERVVNYGTGCSWGVWHVHISSISRI